MASITTAASFLAVPAASKKYPPTNVRRSAVVVRASKDSDKAYTQEERNTRRDLMFAVAAAATCAVARVAMAEEPKRGTSEARKKYAAVCVTMPTARICHN